MADLNTSNLTTATDTANDAEGHTEAVNLQIRIAIYCLIAIAGIIGNAFVIYIMGMSKKMRSKFTNQFIINQSAIDLLGSVLVVVQSTTRYNTGGHFGWTGEFYCRIWRPNILMWSAFMSSTYNLVALTLERYFQVYYPIKHKTSFGPKQARVIFVVIWLCGAAYHFPLILLTHRADEKGYCLSYVFPIPELKRFIGFLNAILKLFLPVAIMVFAYGHMYSVIQSKVQPMPDRKNESNQQYTGHTDKMETASKNVLKILAGVCIAYFVCWVFNQTYFVLLNAGVALDRSSLLYHFTVMMAFLNSCINPFIYSFSYMPFKLEVRRRICGLKNDAGEQSLTG